jgi:hypothetical protein
VEFKGFKIDFTALALLATAISGLVMQLRGHTKRKGSKDDKETKQTDSTVE